MLPFGNGVLSRRRLLFKRDAVLLFRIAVLRKRDLRRRQRRQQQWQQQRRRRNLPVGQLRLRHELLFAGRVHLLRERRPPRHLVLERLTVHRRWMRLEYGRHGQLQREQLGRHVCLV